MEVEVLSFLHCIPCCPGERSSSSLVDGVEVDVPLGTANTSPDGRGMGAYLVFLMCSSLTHQRRRDIGVREVTDK